MFVKLVMLTKEMECCQSPVILTHTSIFLYDIVHGFKRLFLMTISLQELTVGENTATFITWIQYNVLLYCTATHNCNKFVECQN